MPKSATAVVQTEAPPPNTIRVEPEKLICLHTQGKGGVFKSGSAWLTAQYLLTKYGKARCWDTDPTNHTLANFELLPVERVDVIENNKIHPEKFDDLITQLVSLPGPHVVDTGATNFHATWDYIAQNNLIDFLRESQDRRVIVHCPIVGGQALADTLSGFVSMAAYVPNDAIVVWQNEYFGPVSAQKDGTTRRLDEFEVVLRNFDKIFGFVRIGSAAHDLYKADLSKLLEDRLTFPEALTGTRYNLMVRHRLKRLQDDIFGQLEEIGL